MPKLKLLFLVSVLVLSGCSSTKKYVVPTSSTTGELSTVHIYRTDVALHSLNPEKPFFFIDGKEVAKLGTGQAKSTKVTPGPHIITVREPLLFTPSYENGRIEHTFEAGQEYFVRYSKEFGSVIPIAGQVTVTGNTSFGIVDRQMYLNRQ